jgi:type VI secretion system protein ImpC
VCAAAHTPFIAAAAPSLLKMESWQDLTERHDLTKIVSTPEHASWNGLRQTEDARYIGLTMPRALARLPYGAKSDPVEAFNFEEDTDGSDHQKYVWMNAAYCMGVNVNRSFKLYGWCARIRGVESGGVVTDLPVHAFPTDDGGVANKWPNEIAIDDRREPEFAKLGLMPVLHRKNTDIAAFIGAQSLHQPEEHENPYATANARLSARLPYLFAASRFAHYLEDIARHKVGCFKDEQALQESLQRWIGNYVDSDPEHSTEVVKAQKPLREAEVVIEEVEGDPASYSAHFHLRRTINWKG